MVREKNLQRLTKLLLIVMSVFIDKGWDADDNFEEFVAIQRLFALCLKHTGWGDSLREALYDCCFSERALLTKNASLATEQNEVFKGHGWVSLRLSSIEGEYGHQAQVFWLQNYVDLLVVMAELFFNPAASNVSEEALLDMRLGFLFREHYNGGILTLVSSDVRRLSRATIPDKRSRPKSDFLGTLYSDIGSGLDP